MPLSIRSLARAGAFGFGTHVVRHLLVQYGVGVGSTVTRGVLESPIGFGLIKFCEPIIIKIASRKKIAVMAKTNFLFFFLCLIGLLTWEFSETPPKLLPHFEQ